MKLKTLGVFDSGLGGLTVVRELRKKLPRTDLIYLGDTARLPYGTKSDETIRRYLTEGCQFLASLGVEGVVLACNTMSSLIAGAGAGAGPGAQAEAAKLLGLPLFGVIDPVARTAASSLKIGVLGTPATIDSKAYERAIHKSNPRAQVYAVAAPILVPLVEEGWIEDEITESVIRRYLAPLVARDIEVLILGCTHYPLLMSPLRAALESLGAGHLRLLANGVPLSEELCERFEAADDSAGSLTIYVTDAPRRFSEAAERFLGESPSRVEQVRLYTS